jgi:beta-lactamase class A
MSPVLQSALDDVSDAMPQVEWSIAMAMDGAVIASVNADAMMRTASMGKVFLLIEVARRIADGSLDPAAMLTAEHAELVADSGLWQHFRQVPLTVSAAAVLVASVSDNLATNLLLDLVGLDSVTSISMALSMPNTALLDRIRDQRGPGHPVAPSMARAVDLAALMHRIWKGDVIQPAVGRQVRDWLRLGVDLSMVASAFHLDPLAHVDDDLRLMNKTGTDVGVRADAGAFRGSSGCVSYAVIANWAHDEAERSTVDGQLRVDQVMSAMASIGRCLRESAT